MKNQSPQRPMGRANALPVAPEFRQLPPPIILIGMHRSGTSLVAGMLSIMGVYLDPEFTPCCHQDDASLQPNPVMRESGYGEATCFRLLNEAILAEAGASWTEIKPFLDKRDDPKFREKSLKKMSRAMCGEMKTEFFGERRPVSIDAWGWKDPRNSLTLSYWLELFPDARIIHVRRKPDGIVKSMMRRATAAAESSEAVPSYVVRLRALLKSPERIVRAVSRRLKSTSTSQSRPTNLLDATECYDLSEAYVREASRFADGRNCFLEMDYEAILSDPEACAKELAQFLKLTPSAAKLDCAARFVKPREASATSETRARDRHAEAVR